MARLYADENFPRGAVLLGDAARFHEQETHGVTQRPGFVEPLSKKSDRRGMEVAIHVNHFHFSVVFQVKNEIERCLSRQTAYLSKSHELGQDVVMGETERSSAKKRDGVGMLPFRFVMEAEQARSVEQHHAFLWLDLPYSRAKSASMSALSAPVGRPRSTAPP